MDTELIENEIQARVNFKLSELATGLRNRAKTAWHIAFHTNSQKHSHYWEAFEQMVKMLEQEREMPVPHDNMYLTQMREKRDQAVNEILNMIPRGSKEWQSRHLVSQIVSIIEKVQNIQPKL